MDEPLEPYEPLEPVLPRPSTPAYLPRLWKSPPEPEDEAVAAREKKKREAEASKAAADKPKHRKKKKAEPVAVDASGTVKLEETPVLDTYEARQRARWIIGGLLTAIGLIALFIILKTFQGSGEEEIREGEPPSLVIANVTKPNLELEARTILNNAKLSDRKGKGQVALDLLNKVVKTYPGTAAAREALHAIDRNRHGQSLFGDDSTALASRTRSASSAASTPTGPSPPKPEPKAPVAPAPAPDPAIAATTSPPIIAPQPAPLPITAPAPAPIALKPLPRGFRPKPNATIHASGWPTRIVCERDGAEMVLVPGGTFLMGREDGDPPERPAHRVVLSTYYIDLHEVTVRQFVQFLKETGRPVDAARLTARETAAPTSPEDLPAVNLSAREAKAYCNWAERKLPTEAQWEMAARSADGRISYWNGEIPRKNSPKGIRVMEPVMTLPSDVAPCGAFDMGANAWEWTAEYYDSRYYKQLRDLVQDPTGPKESPAKIAQVTVKGGSKAGILTWRDGLKLETRLPYLGFRGALSVEGAPAASPTAPATDTKLPSGVVPF